ncbi:PREDICTED: peroxidase 3-like [Ipomoea nil]|uniref:peroxidase 3-like n=1 Tax=Ipomoea nil TaxID=35883 RepID=UPI0009010CD5|nr:PREDICTED: peroxidase 3-like [Ipomoea nil]
MAATIVRLQRHDCFVTRCDGSTKEELEQSCPGVVSCADILTFSPRDVLVLSGVPQFDVPGWRSDENVSREADVGKHLASPDNTVDQIFRWRSFQGKRLDVEDLVVLLGALSISVAHCSNFRYWLNDPAKAKEVDVTVKVVMHGNSLPERDEHNPNFINAKR